jgi:hypothetical protein
MTNLRELSRQNFTGQANNQDINTGCMQRIADAVEKTANASEKMASNYTYLQNQHDLYKRFYNEEREKTARLYRRIAALQGVITKMKKRKTS